MSLRIEIETDNAAFKPDAARELARILSGIVADLEQYPAEALEGQAKLRDQNGHTVGYLEITQ